LAVAYIAFKSPADSGIGVLTLIAVLPPVGAYILYFVELRWVWGMFGTTEDFKTK
jgi:hypothetical protein